MVNCESQQNLKYYYKGHYHLHHIDLLLFIVNLYIFLLINILLIKMTDFSSLYLHTVFLHL